MKRNREAAGPQSLHELLSDSGTPFGKLLQHAERVDKLGEQVSRLLDRELAEHCRLANDRDGNLVFVCASAVWSSRLLMVAPQLIESLREAGIGEFKQIEVKTRPVTGRTGKARP